MKFEELFEEWNKDTEIDKTELANEALKIPKLHHKYYTLFCKERAILKSLEAEMKKLKLEKFEFYTLGPTQESKDKGWKLPARGMILKQDIQTYMDGDKEIIELSLKIGVAQEKVDFLDSIIKSLQHRGYLIKSAIDFQKFIMGG